MKELQNISPTTKSQSPETDALADRAWDGASDDYSAYAKMLGHARKLERELGKVQLAHGYVIRCLKSHHMTRAGIPTLVKNTESITRPNADVDARRDKTPNQLDG